MVQRVATEEEKNEQLDKVEGGGGGKELGLVGDKILATRPGNKRNKLEITGQRAKLQRIREQGQVKIRARDR